MIGEARRHPLARRLRLLHLLTWAALIVFAALFLLLPQGVGAQSFSLMLILMLLPIQLTLLALVYAVLARARSRAAGATTG
jgi:amino acid transporter